MIIDTLTTRRTEIAAQIRELQTSLTHIDATIKLFQGEHTPAKRIRHEGLTRAIYDCIRSADKPLTTSKIAGMINADAKRVGIALAAQAKKGLINGDWRGREKVWGIVKVTN